METDVGVGHHPMRQQLLTCLKCQGLSIGDASICSGLNYTFNVDGVSRSYINHLVLSKSLISHIKKYMVLEEELPAKYIRSPYLISISTFEVNTDQIFCHP